MDEDPDAAAEYPTGVERRRPVARRARSVLVRSVLVLLLAAAVAVVPLVGMASSQAGDTPVPAAGRLRTSPAARGTVRLPGWLVTLDGTRLVVRAAGSGRVAWSSVPGRAFLGAAASRTRWRAAEGMFRPHTAYLSVLADQDVSRRTTTDDSVSWTGGLSGDGRRVTYRCTLTTAGPGALRMDVRFDTEGADRPDTVLLTAAHTPGVAVRGFGEQYGGLDMSGRRIPIVTREQGVGRGEQPVTALANLTHHHAGGDATTSYAPMPWYLTGDLRGFGLVGTRYSLFDLTRTDRIALALHDTDLHAVVSTGDTPAALLRVHTRRTGRMSVLPAWTARGAVLGVQGGTARVRRVTTRMLAAGAVISAVWIQDWTGVLHTSLGQRVRWNWRLDTARYPHWDELVSWLHARGIRVLLYLNPFLAEEPEGHGMYRYARAHGYLVRRSDGGVYLLDQGGFRAALVDLTDPAAADWYAHDLARRMAALHASGWMADFGEELPFDAALHAGSATRWHNRWPVAWAALNERICRLAGQPDCVTFLRSAGSGSPGHARLFWAGDQMVDWSAEDGLRSALYGMLNAGVSGMTLIHSDTGGYTTVNIPGHDYHRSAELLRRWSELSVFSALLRTHEGSRPADNAQVYSTPAARAAFARMTRLYAALADYRLAAERQAASSGMPLMRPMWLASPGTAAAHADDEFFFGPSLLVAPVLKPGARSVRVVLPPGRWQLLWTGRNYGTPHRSSTVVVPAPLGSPPVLYRADDPTGRRLRRSLPPDMTASSHRR